MRYLSTPLSGVDSAVALLERLALEREPLYAMPSAQAR